MSESDRLQYVIGLCTIDVLYPVYYCTLAAMTLAFLLQNTNLPSDIILIVYFIGVVDLLENIAIVTSLLTYPHSPMFSMYAAGLFTATKWVLFSTLAAFILYLIFFYTRIKHMSKKKVKSSLQEAIRIAKTGKTVCIMSTELPHSGTYITKFKQDNVAEEVVNRIRLNTVNVLQDNMTISGIVGADCCILTRGLQQHEDLFKKLFSDKFDEIISV